jgi:hypothetical protein
MSTSQAKSYLRFPVISHGAEFLVQGYLMRRNILTYKAPQNNAGYDLICVHPDHPNKTRPICVQVKSRYATDCDRGFPVKEQTFKHFDFLIAVFLNSESLSSTRFRLNSSGSITTVKISAGKCNFVGLILKSTEMKKGSS